MSKRFDESWDEEYLDIKHLPKSKHNKKYGDGNYLSKDKMKSKKKKDKRYNDGVHK